MNLYQASKNATLLIRLENYSNAPADFVIGGGILKYYQPTVVQQNQNNVTPVYVSHWINGPKVPISRGNTILDIAGTTTADKYEILQEYFKQFNYLCDYLRIENVSNLRGAILKRFAVFYSAQIEDKELNINISTTQYQSDIYEDKMLYTIGRDAGLMLQLEPSPRQGVPTVVDIQINIRKLLAVNENLSFTPVKVKGGIPNISGAVTRVDSDVLDLSGISTTPNLPSGGSGTNLSGLSASNITPDTL